MNGRDQCTNLALEFDPVRLIVQMLNVFDCWGGKEEVAREEILTVSTVALLWMPEKRV